MDIDTLFPPPQRLTPRQQERIRSVLRDEISPAISPGRSRRDHRRWRLLAAPAAAAAAVTAIAIAAAVLVPSGHPSSRSRTQHPALAPSSASRILLAAAVKVAHQHPGKYWHFLESGGSAQWVERNGNYWTAPPCKAGLSGKAVMYMAGGISDALGSATLTYDLVQHWPTNPARLMAKIASYDHNESDDLGALVDLEIEVPAPPGVRAAAYRAIAALPGLMDEGLVQGGHQVLIPALDGGPAILVINPVTGLLHSWVLWANSGEPWAPGTGSSTSAAVSVAQWANHLPKVLPDNKYYCS